MGTPLGPKYIPYTYMDPLGASGPSQVEGSILRLLVVGWQFTVHLGKQTTPNVVDAPRRTSF